MLLWGGRQFRPNLLPGLRAWYNFSDSAYLTLSGSSITSALDKSGNGNTLSQGTGSAQPTLTSNQINGVQAAVFDGADFLAGTISGIFTGTDQPFTVIHVSKTTTVALQYIWNAGRTTDATPVIGTNYTAANAYRVIKRDNASTTLNPSGGTYVSGTAEILSTICNGTTVTLNKNGTAAFTAQNLDVGATTINQLTLGCLNGGGTQGVFLTGAIGEIVCYNRELNNSELAQVRKYFGARWGITVV